MERRKKPNVSRVARERIARRSRMTFLFMWDPIPRRIYRAPGEPENDPEGIWWDVAHEGLSLILVSAYTS